MARRRWFTQQGLTLVELLVATAVGLLVLLAAQVLFASANAAYVAQGQDAEAQQGGRYALDTIGRALRQSAWRDLEQADPGKAFDPAAPAHVAGLDAHSISKGGDGIANPLPSSVNGSDVLAVRFSGAGPAPSGDGTMLSCAGFPAHEHAEGWSIFYVARGGDGTGELRCKYRATGGWGADAIVTGVDSFQVLYGLDTDDPADGVPNRYVNASAIEELDAALVLAGSTAAEREQDLNRKTHWKRVASVQYALLLRGAEARSLGRSRTYDLFGPAYGDRFGTSDAGTRLSEVALAGVGAPRQRRIFMATVALRGGRR
ncbi:PilW family protein [Massilia agilis]|uniref:PilW family protein n=1 Tax=Massilia agilis TaxID=1811226 RepID=A0ABT2DAM3_9BURK|nr:PilW family protein [Massilia agilis]MCS0808365.1 PilW family protein [Massilia agilis]